MREHHLSVVTLEEFEPNREFVGRNFNAGEVIQLVLKSPSSGRWLPFEYVQMVMMHELAHCKLMNHSRAFWAVRNQYAAQMYGLWARGYTGDGIWGRGANLASGEWETNTVREGEVLPEHLCGGTFRSRGRRGRKRKPKLSYKEQKERRTLKKFGKNGVALGADDVEKVKLEKGKKVTGKPRVAGSARGRELRAAAALARFDKQKKEEEDVEELWDVKDEDETASGSESEFEEVEVEGKDALDVDGSRMLDKDGHALVKVCEDEDPTDSGARNELDELRDVFRGKKIKTEPGTSQATTSSTPRQSTTRVKDEPREKSPDLSEIPPPKPTKSLRIKPEPKSPMQQTTLPLATPASTSASTSGQCSMCSYANTEHTLTCAMCSNVLDPSGAPGSWQCKGESCKGLAYFNCADSGTCGVCGKQR